MRQIEFMTVLTFAISGTTLTHGFSQLETSHRHSCSRVPFTRPLASRILTRNLNPTKFTLHSSPRHPDRMAMKKRDGSEIDENITLMKTESRNTSQQIKNIVQNAVNNIQVKAVSVYLFATITLAKMGKIGLYNDNLIGLDLAITLFVGIASVIFVKTITRLSTDGILQARDSRKIIHMFSAPLFMIFWPLFSNAWGARIFAAMITFFQGVRLFLAGTKRGGNGKNCFV